MHVRDCFKKSTNLDKGRLFYGPLLAAGVLKTVVHVRDCFTGGPGIGCGLFYGPPLAAGPAAGGGR